MPADHRRTVRVPGPAGEDQWHLIDRPGTDAHAPVVVCLHGNPTWSHLWSRLVDELDGRYRVVAPDLLGMGYSRAADPTAPRPYTRRVEDLTRLLDTLDLQDPVWLVGQDWGGAIAMGWAVRHPERVAGLVLSNTGIAVPAGRRAPRLIAAAARAPLADLLTRRTGLFAWAAGRLPGAGLSAADRTALRAPYRRAVDRRGIADFLADVPLRAGHRSAGALAEVAARLGDLRIPVRLIWGARDPVFGDAFAEDLLGRFADVRLHRLAAAGHLAVLETPVAPLVADAIAQSTQHLPVASPDAHPAPLWAALERRAAEEVPAIRDLAASGPDAVISFAGFAERVQRVVAHLQARRVRPGDRVAILVPPGVDLLAVVYGCWRMGAVTVIADRGLGLAGLGAAVRSARVRHVIGPTKALLAARVGRWAPGATAIAVSDLRAPAPTGRTLVDPSPEDPAAVLFTSGATGPAKGVRYTHGQLAAQRDALAGTYQITGSDAFVAAFAPFALYGPALGITTALPDMDVTAPATLTAEALGAACRAIGATMVFASPTALGNVIATATGQARADLVGAMASVRTVMSAGAPVPIAVLRAMAEICPTAGLHTPYGMTEVLPVADVDLRARERAGAGRGVCVGHPVPGCSVVIADLDTGELCPTGATGEVLVAAAWMSQGYDRLWHTEWQARGRVPAGVAPVRWHRSGDLGHLDAEGRLWIEGRVAHLITTPTGPVTPVPVEIAAETIPGVRRAAAVGVGPAGVQQVVVVLETGTDALAPAGVRDAVRSTVDATVGVEVAAVWTVTELPVDIRHNAKIDRAAVAARMARVLAGERP